MVQCEIYYEGGLRIRAVHGPSGDSLLTDAPIDNRGKGEAFSPTDLLGVALGTCVLTLMGITAQSFGRDLDATQAKVEKTMKATPMRHIGRLALIIEVGGEWTTEERTAMESAARGCPVMASLGERVEIDLQINWKG